MQYLSFFPPSNNSLNLRMWKIKHKIRGIVYIVYVYCILYGLHINISPQYEYKI